MFCRWFCRSHVTSRWPRQVETFDGATALLPSTTTQKANALTHSGDYNPFLIRYFVLYGRQAGRQAAVAGWLAGWLGRSMRHDHFESVCRRHVRLLHFRFFFRFNFVLVARCVCSADYTVA